MSKRVFSNKALLQKGDQKGQERKGGRTEALLILCPRPEQALFLREKVDVGR